jgi:Icc-related predicted phosphoesterase
MRSGAQPPGGSRNLFVRNATGLVRELNAFDAFNLVFSAVLIPVGITEVMAFTPIFWPHANMLLSFLLATPLVATCGLVYLYFTVIMPRSGGDYVWVSRTLTPFLGFFVNFSITFVFLTWIAFNFTYMLAVMGPAAAYVGGWHSAALTSPDNAELLVIATVLTALFTILMIFGVRVVARYMVITFAVVWVGMIAWLVAMAVGSHGHYPYRTTDEELDQTWDNPAAVHRVFIDLMRESLERWMTWAEQKLTGTGVQAYVMTGNDDPPELREMIGQSGIVTDPEDRLVDLGEGMTMISCGWSNRTPWNSPREMDEDDLDRHMEKLAAEVPNAQRSVFNLHVPPIRTAIDQAPKLNESLKPVVKGGAVLMESVGSEAVRRVIERHQPMLSLHGHIHESRGAIKIGRTLCINPGSEYADGVLQGALIELNARKGIKSYQLPSG